MLELIREVQSGVVDARGLGADERRACVAYLTAEGYSVPEIAQVLRASDRTVHRDRERVRAERALRPSSDLIAELVGQLSSEAATAVQRLRRLGRDKDAPHAARVDAEKGAWQVFREFVQSMQRLGYLPMAVPSLRADVTHRFGADDPGGDGLPRLEEMHAELARLEAIQRDVGGDGARRSAIEVGVGQVRGVLLRLEAGHRLESVRRVAECVDRESDGTDGEPSERSL